MPRPRLPTLSGRRAFAAALAAAMLAGLVVLARRTQASATRAQGSAPEKSAAANAGRSQTRGGGKTDASSRRKVRPDPGRSAKLAEDLSERFARHDLVSFDARAVARQVRETGKLTLTAGGSRLDLQLTPHDVRAPGYRAEEIGPGGQARAIAPGPLTTFRGPARGGTGDGRPGEARFTIDEGGVEGLVITPGGRYFVEPARKFSDAAQASDFVIYEESSVIASDSGSCGVTLAEQVEEQSVKIGAGAKGKTPKGGVAKGARDAGVSASAAAQDVPASAAALRELRIATEADFEYVQAAGGAAAANREILGILNQVAGLYEVELGLSLRVVYQSAWSSSNDPYSSSNPSALLGELTDYWNVNRGSVARDVVHMWTGRTLDNAALGTAYIEALCRYVRNVKAAYGLSRRTTGAQRVAITAHEIGHNLGASHPNQQAPPVAECASGVMNSSLGSSPQLTFCQYSRGEIARYLAGSESCLGEGVSGLDFSGNKNYPVGQGPYTVAAGDFNGDGKLDLATANAFTSDVSVLIGTDNGAFQPAVNYPIQGSPSSVVVGDFNSDGKLDIVTNSYGYENIPHSVSVLPGTGMGTFQPAVNYLLERAPDSLAAADFNGDGKLDIVTASYQNQTSDISVLLNTGTGTFQQAVNYAVGVQPEVVGVGDFNGDGKVDIVTANFNADSDSDFNIYEFGDTDDVSLLLGTGAGTFQQAVNYPIGAEPVAVTVGDFNGDGRDDLAVAHHNDAFLSVLISTSTGAFQQPVHYPLDLPVHSVAAGDFNGDGRTDLATEAGHVLLGAGTGTFQLVGEYEISGGAYWVIVADTNGDGKADLVTANSFSDDVSVLLGTGTGAFQQNLEYPVGTTPRPIVVADFNSDGKADLATGNVYSDDVSVLLGAGAGTFQPAVNSPSGYLPSALAVADFNGDGKPDLITDTANVLIGTGTGTFHEAFSLSRPDGSATGPFSVAVGDFNADGKSDVVRANRGNADVSVWLGTGRGSFEYTGSYGVGSGIPGSVGTGDFNGDGKTDIATANNNASDEVSVLLGTGAGAFQQAVSYSLLSPDFGQGSRLLEPDSLAVADFNGDGRSDLAVAHSFGGGQSADSGVSVLLSAGPGGFQPVIHYGMGAVNAAAGTSNLAVGDMNGDGKPDIVAPKPLKSEVTVLLSTGTDAFRPTTSFPAGYLHTAAVGDLNGDGKQDIAVTNEFKNSARVLLNTSGQFTNASSNDNFPSAQFIRGPFGTINGSTVLATKEVGEPNHAAASGGTGGASIWYRWTAPSTGRFHFETFGSSFPSVVAVYTGTSVSALTSVTASTSARPEYVEFDATAGTVYQIAIDGVTGDTGRTVMRWNPGSRSNDNFADAREIRGSSGSVPGDNAGFTLEANEPQLPGPATAGFSAWYRWTAPNTGRVSFTAGPCGDTVRLLGSYTGNFIDVLQRVAVNYDGYRAAGDTSVCDSPALRFNAVAGSVYRIQLQSAQARPFALSWEYADPPPNDNFSNALVLSGQSGSLTGTNKDAGKEAGEPNHAGNAGGASVWYRWTAPSNGTYTFDATGFRNLSGTSYSYIRALVAVYTGTSLGALTQVAADSSSNKVTFNATAGTTYHVAVDSAQDNAGAFLPGALPLRWGPKAAANDDFAHAQIINSSAAFSAQLGTNAGATKEAGEPAHAGQPGGASVWYRWTALSSGPARFALAGCASCTLPAGSALVGVYTGAAVGALTPVTLSADGSRTFDAQSGRTYHIAVDAAGAAAGTYEFSLVSAAASARNDAFASAQEISGSAGSVVGDNSAATKEAGEPAHANDRGGSSVWYRWTAPAAGLYTFDTFGSSFDTLLGVYTGNSVSALASSGGSDNHEASQQSRVTVNATVDTTYYIAVDGKGSGVDPATGAPRAQTGLVQLSWSSLPAPANDDFASAQVIAGAAGSAAGRNTVATKEGGEPNHAGGTGGSSVWYRWIAPAGGGTFTFATAGSEFNTTLAVYTGGAVEALTEVASDDDSGGATQSRVTFNAAGGTTYHVAVDGSVGVPGNPTLFRGNLLLAWSPAAGLNDGFAQAQELTGASGSVAGTNAGASEEAGEPNHANDRGGRSVWYRWTAPSSGRFLFTTLGSSFDTVLAVYTGASVGSLAQVAANDDSPHPDNLAGHVLTSSLSFDAVGGTTYRIALDGSGGRPGNFALRWGPEASVGGAVSFLAGQCGANNKVTFILSGEDARTVTLTGSGRYQFEHLRVGGNYSVRAVMELSANCFPLFLERAQNYFPLAAPVTNGDFTDDGLRGGGGTSTINGRVTNAQGVGIDGVGDRRVTITLSGTQTNGVAISHNSYPVGDGNYILSSLNPGQYTVTPSCPGVVFTPDKRDLTVTNSEQPLNGADFKVVETYTIGGQVRDAGGAPLPGVTVTLSGDASATTETDPGGYYALSAVAGGTYQVAASKPGLSFTAPVSVPSISANQKNADFVATAESPAPTLASLSPAAAAAGSGPLVLTVTGANFVNASVVNWNGSARTTTYVSHTQLTAEIPASDLQSAGAASVTAVTPAPGGGASSALTFTISAPAASLRLDSVSPRAGRAAGGQQVVLAGEFAGLSSVALGGAQASWSYTNGANDTTRVTVTTPAHAAGLVAVELAPSSGSAVTAQGAFRYLQPAAFQDEPLVANVTPMRALHVVELRQAIDALRAAAGLAPAQWAEPSLAGALIRAAHLQELRDRLEEAAAALGFPPAQYAPGLGAGSPVRRVHIEELRQRIHDIAG